jgi:hypothetical protein
MTSRGFGSCLKSTQLHANIRFRQTEDAGLESMGLRQFSPDEIYIDKHEAWTILKFFWPQISISEKDLTDQDVNFAQGLLVEAIDSSYRMGYVEILFKSFYGKVPGSFTDVQTIIKDFMKQAAKHWFKHLGKKKPSEATIYEMVRVDIARNFRSVIQIRQDTGELTY